MSIIKTIQRSKEDFKKPKVRSYANYDLQVKMIDIRKILDKEKEIMSSTEKRTLLFELSGKEPIEKVMVLDNANKKLGKITIFQMKEILNDMGFNMDPWMWGKHQADIEAVMNVNGFSVPGWVRFSRMITKFLPSYEKALITKLSPGNDRLHLSIFENNDGAWIITAHTDHNWLSLNLPRVLKSHVGHGAGDYITGTEMIQGLFTFFAECIKENRVMTVKNIDKILNKAYDRSLAVKLGIKSHGDFAFFYA